MFMFGSPSASRRTWKMLFYSLRFIIENIWFAEAVSECNSVTTRSLISADSNVWWLQNSKTLKNSSTKEPKTFRQKRPNQDVSPRQKKSHQLKIFHLQPEEQKLFNPAEMPEIFHINIFSLMKPKTKTYERTWRTWGCCRKSTLKSKPRT